MSGWDTFGIWLAALFTLGIFSFLYKDNPFYKICEAFYVGLSAGYWVVTYHWTQLVPYLYDPLRAGVASFSTSEVLWAEFLVLFPLALGVMMLARLIPSVGWISRWPLAFVVGYTAGLRLITYLQSNVMAQLQNSVEPVIQMSDSGTFMFWDSANSLLVILGTAAGLFYFFFSKEHKGAFGTVAKIGTWFLMVTFGAAFGYTVMGRMALLIGRIDFLVADWLHLIH